MARLAITLIFLAGAIVLGLFYLRPTWEEFRNIRTETDALEAISGELDDLIQNRDALIAAINSISREDLLRIDRALPQGQDAPTLLTELERLAKNRGLGLRRLDVTGTVASLGAGAPPRGELPRPSGEEMLLTPPERTKTVRELPFTLEILGSYEGMKGFLGDLERSLRIMDVGDITFTAPARADVPFDVTLKMKTYHQ